MAESNEISLTIFQPDKGTVCILSRHRIEDQIQAAVVIEIRDVQTHIVSQISHWVPHLCYFSDIPTFFVLIGQTHDASARLYHQQVHHTVVVHVRSRNCFNGWEIRRQSALAELPKALVGENTKLS